MTSVSPVYLIRMVAAAAAVCVYAFLFFLAYQGLDERNVVTVTRHVILVPGLIPLLCWLTLLLVPAPPSWGKLLLVAVVVTCFHVLVFAVSAHASDLAYWAIQAIEVLALWPVLMMVSRQA